MSTYEILPSMKKTLFLTLLSALVLAGCSSDENEIENSGTESSAKHITHEIYTNEYNENVEWKYTYDLQGRMSRMIAYENGKEKYSASYEYSETQLIYEEQDQYSSGKTIYKIKDGKAVEATRDGKVIAKFTYDSNGYIKTINKSSVTFNIIWGNGDVDEVAITGGGSEHSVKYTHSDIAFDKAPLHCYDWEDWHQEGLLALGYMGKKPKHCPSKASGYCNFSYITDKDGYVTKEMQTSESGNHNSWFESYTYTWE